MRWSGTDQPLLHFLLALALLPACGHDDVVPPGDDQGGTNATDILFFDPEPDPFTTAPWWGPVSVDIDLDSVTDIELRVLYALDSTVPWPEALWGTQAVCVDPDFSLSIGTINSGYDPIDLGDAIDGSLTWWNAATLHNQQPWGGPVGFWSYPHEGFIGVQRIHGDTVNYGWISVRTGLDHIIYQSSGFERVPDRGIVAGDTGQ